VVKTLTVRAKQYVKNKASGMSNYQAAIKAGYSHNTALNARENIEKRAVGKTLQKVMDKYGLSEEKLVDSLVEGLKHSYKLLVKGGMIIITPDYVCRHRYLETALRLKGYSESGERDNAIEKPISITISE
jgi:hypothetical protein